ncbi:MAG: pyrroline-5-carboxylate reductase [Armatimonadota bacterium]
MINKIAIIGTGAMGLAIAGGMIKSNLIKPEHIVMSDVDFDKLQFASEKFGVTTKQNNIDAIKDADVIILAVKPNIISSAIGSFSESLKKEQIIISIAAGVTTSKIESLVSTENAVIRAMPNTPCQIGAGATAVCRGSYVNDDDIKIAFSIFEAVGICVEVPENLMNAVTGLSGSGPAYTFMMIEAMTDAGVRMGLPRDKAQKLASQTVLGSAEMVIKGDKHPAQLKDQVTSPGGTTIAAIDTLEKNSFRSAIIEAVKAATKRSEELG